MLPTEVFNGQTSNGSIGLWIGSTALPQAKDVINSRFGLFSRIGQKPSLPFATSRIDHRRLQITIVSWAFGEAIASWSCWETCLPFGRQFLPSSNLAPSSCLRHLCSAEMISPTVLNGEVSGTSCAPQMAHRNLIGSGNV